jgi:hypothetical protein
MGPQHVERRATRVWNTSGNVVLCDTIFGASHARIDAQCPFEVQFSKPTRRMQAMNSNTIRPRSSAVFLCKKAGCCPVLLVATGN